MADEENVTEQSATEEKAGKDASIDEHALKIQKLTEAKYQLDAKSEAFDNSAKKLSEAGNDILGGDVSAATIGRMLGLLTRGDFKVFEGKIDLIQTKVNSFSTKLDFIQEAVLRLPTGNDFERLEAQIASLRTTISEVGKKVSQLSIAAETSTEGEEGTDEEAALDAEKSKKIRENIVTNKPAGSRY